MKPRTLRRWLPVGLYVAATLGIWAFAFLPFHGRAQKQSERAQGLSNELDAKISVIESLPKQRADLEALAAQLSRFRASLSGTQDVDKVMDDFRSRAEAHGLDLWILNPSVPTLIKLEAGSDSLTRLDLAVLPVAFECHGNFQRVADFLESEETRADFYRWQSFSLSADVPQHGVQAKGEIQIFLLPEPAEAGPA